MAAYMDAEREKQQKELEEKAAAIVQEQEQEQESNPFAAYIPSRNKARKMPVIKFEFRYGAWKFEITIGTSSARILLPG
jgi:hypothetical protein